MSSQYKLSVILLIAFLSCNETTEQKNKQKPAAATNETEKIKLAELNGNAINLQQYKGKTIFINFWATWCKPCVEEMPSIASAMQKVNRNEVVFLFASNEEAAEIKSFQQRTGYSFHFVHITNFEELNIMALPTTYIFNTKGQLFFSEMGYRKWDTKENIQLINNGQ